MATDFGGAIYYTDIYLCKYDSIEVIRQGDSRPLLFDLPIFNFRFVHRYIRHGILCQSFKCSITYVFFSLAYFFPPQFTINVEQIYRKVI